MARELSAEILEFIAPYENKWCMYICRTENQDYAALGLAEGMVAIYGYTDDIKNALMNLKYNIDKVIYVMPAEDKIHAKSLENTISCRGKYNEGATQEAIDNKLFTATLH